MSEESSINKKRKWAIASRWFSISVMTVAIVFVLFILGEICDLKGIISPLSVGELACFSFACALILSLPPFNFSLTIKSLSRRGSWSYPPASFAIYISLFFAIVIMTGRFCFVNNGIGLPEKVFALSAIYLAIFLGSLTKGVFYQIMFYLHRKTDSEVLNAKAPTNVDVKDNGETWTLDYWLKNDTPIRSSLDDKLGFGRLVDKIIDEIEKNGHFALGVEGSHGAGKSSLTTLIEEKMLRNNEKSLFVRLDSWGMSGDGAVDTVLREIIRALESEGIDCLAIRKLPEDYFKAINGAHKSGFLFTSLLKESMTTKSVLLRLDRILKATNYRIILCIEDLDRSDESVMQTITPLLDRFRRYTETVSFIFELTYQEEFRILDNIRLFDFVEKIPKLPNTKVWSLFCQLFHKVKSKYQDDILVSHENDKYFYEKEVIDHWLTPKQGLLIVADTPRVLKRVLKKISYSWNSLHGEVDLIELTIITALQISKPAVFNFLVQNINTLWEIIDIHEIGTEATEKSKGILELWGKITFVSNHEREAVEHMLTKIGMPLFEDHYSVNMRRIPQGIFSDNASDYWQRIIAGSLEDEETSDQEVLKFFKKIVESSFSKDMFTRLNENPSFVSKIRQYRHYSELDFVKQFFESEHLRVFISQYNKYLLEKDGVDVDLSSNPTVVEIRTIISKRAKNVVSAEWLLNEIKIAVKTSLSMAIGLVKTYLRFAFGKIPEVNSDVIVLNGTRVPVLDCEFMRDEQLEHLFRGKIVQEFTKQFKAGRIDLEKILPNKVFESIECLNSFVWLIIWGRETNEFGPNYWSFLAPALASLMKSGPVEVITQIGQIFFFKENDEALKKFNFTYFEEMIIDQEQRKDVANALLKYDVIEEKRDSVEFGQLISNSRDRLITYIQCVDGNGEK